MFCCFGDFTLQGLKSNRSCTYFDHSRKFYKRINKNATIYSIKRMVVVFLFITAYYHLILQKTSNSADIIVYRIKKSMLNEAFGEHTKPIKTNENKSQN